MKLTTSYQREINDFSKTIASGDFTIKEVTAGALTQARAKLNPWAFQRLRDVATESFYAEAPYNTWRGMRLLAVDGSTISLPYSESIVADFGKEGYMQKQGAPKSLGRASLLYDVLNDVTLDAHLESYKTSEKALFVKHLEKIQKDDLLLGDRNYGTSYILHAVQAIGAKYCIRLSNDKRKEVQIFVESNKKSEVVELKSIPSGYEKMGMSKKTKPLKVRLIRVELDSGEVEVLATNLMDKKLYPAAIFKELYFKRWQVEEAYKLLKQRINLELFSARTAIGIRQDFHAKILMMTLCATLAHPIAEKVKKEYSAEKTGNMYDQQINKTDALAQTKNSLIDIFLKRLKQKTIDIWDKIVESSRTPIRPNRKNHRIKSPRKRKPTNYKPL